MKSCLAVFFLMTSAACVALAQTPSPIDPSISGSTLVQSSEVFLLWGEGPGQNSMLSNQQIFRYLDSTSLSPQQRLTGYQRRTDSAVAGNLQMDVVTADFDGNKYEDVVAAWEGPNHTISLLFPHIDPHTLSWSTASRFTVAGPVTPYAGEQRGRIFVKAGDIDGDPLDEFLLAYQGADSTIHLEVYEVDSNLVPTLKASLHDQFLPPVPASLARFSGTLGDLNGDFEDEIILAVVDSGAGGVGKWGLTVRIYDLDGDKLVAKASTTVFVQPADNVSELNLALATGRFDDDIADEIAFAFVMNRSGSGDDTYLYLLKSSFDLSTVSFDPSRRVSRKSISNELKPLALAAGDLNANFRNEVVLGLGGTFTVYETDGLLDLYPRFSGGGQFEDVDDNRLSYEFLAVRDVDRDNRNDIVIAKNTYGSGDNLQKFSLSVFGVDSSFQFATLKGSKSATDTAVDNGGSSYRHYAIALGDFNGDRVRIGQPARTSLHNVVQPLVVLSAPPIHFDMFSGTKYDINKCYNGNTCNFSASYQKSNTRSVEVETQVHSDYTFTAGLGVSGSIGDKATINYEAYFEGKWGKSFAKVQSESHSVSIGVEVNAREDDELYATVTDYDIYDYPVYSEESDTLLGGILVVKPARTESRWFPSKSWSNRLLSTDHEVGNILSYYDSVEHNPHLVQTIRKSYASDSYVLSSSSTFDWYVTFSDFISSSADTSHTAGYEGKLNFVVIVERSYSSTDLSTHRTSVTDLLNLKVHLDNIDMSFGETRYAVTPYAYWGTDGSLVVDYAVRPELAPPGFSPTWWQQRYGSLSDPAFILPWRLDPEKGFTISEEAKRYQSKDISFDNDDPQPGDTVTISVKVRNFSLVPTPAPVPVSLSVGDPDAGGIPIANIYGQTVLFSNILASRGSDEVKFQWIVPPGLPEYPRIYAKLDPLDVISEIHSENNKAFNILGRQPLVTATDMPELSSTIPSKFDLKPSYPNPFNPSTTIEFSLPSDRFVTLKIFDVLGRQVESLISGELHAGTHQQEWNASSFPSGVYFYRLSAGEFTAIEKMLLIK
ncbi:MAG TPA: T9SS type A sorting domain-containing protein [Bacteroidota bacterium]|nr:T9SS type A sorting domain-containing protein [Bacteroidota bacterium]